MPKGDHISLVMKTLRKARSLHAVNQRLSKTRSSYHCSFFFQVGVEQKSRYLEGIMASHTLSIVILSKQLVNLPKQRRVNSGERQRQPAACRPRSRRESEYPRCFRRHRNCVLHSNFQLLTSNQYLSTTVYSMLLYGFRASDGKKSWSAGAPILPLNLLPETIYNYLDSRRLTTFPEERKYDFSVFCFMATWVE